MTNTLFRHYVANAPMLRRWLLAAMLGIIVYGASPACASSRVIATRIRGETASIPSDAHVREVEEGGLLRDTKHINVSALAVQVEGGCPALYCSDRRFVETRKAIAKHRMITLPDDGPAHGEIVRGCGEASGEREGFHPRMHPAHMLHCWGLAEIPDHQFDVNLSISSDFEASPSGQDVGAQLLVSRIASVLNQVSSGFGVGFRNLKGRVSILGGVNGDLCSAPRKHQTVEQSGQAERSNDHLPPRPIGCIAGRVRSLPLCLKIALIVTLWLSAWRLIYDGIDRVDGFAAGGCWRGIGQIIGGLILGVAAGILWL